MHIKIELAKSYLEAGLSVLPARRREKRPAVGAWKPWTERLPTEVEVEAWFANRHDGVCLVTGRVSGNLECIDFDNGAELYGAWKGRVDPSVLGRCVVERSQSGGIHVYYRCEGTVDGNRKLARGMRDGAPKTLVETRGEGGVVMCAPTEGYEILSGALACLPTLSGVERDGLLAAACALDELPAAEVSSRVSDGRTGADSGFLTRPGDDFADRGDPHPYLLAAGWQFCGTAPDGNEQWTRPGKDVKDGLSATLKDKVFYVFSSNAAPFEPGKGYNAFQVYTLLEHRGDFAAAAAALLDKGYGRREDSQAIDFSALNERLANGISVPQPPKADEPEDIPIGELVKAYPTMRPVLIDGFLRLGETMNIIAPPKTGKSWLVTDLALAVAMGTDWFGFQCERGRVLIIDNELHKETTADRVPKVIRARGFDIAKVSPHLSVNNQRGKLKTIEYIGTKIEDYRKKGYRLIIIDAFYRAMPRGIDENDNGAIADVYNMLDRYAQEIGCAFVLIHHTSKGNQAQKAVTDVGAGAGSQSRAADTHVILRRHKEQGVVVMDSVVRSFRSTSPVCLRWDFPLWKRDDSLSADDLEGKVEPKKAKTGTEAALENEEIVRHLRELMPAQGFLAKSAFITAVEKRANVSHAKARRLVDSALDLGYLAGERRTGSDGLRVVDCVLPGPVDPLAGEDCEYDGNDESHEEEGSYGE